MLSQVVRELRLKSKLTSKSLARKVGKNDTWVSQIETGKIVHPDLPAFKSMLRVLGCAENEVDEIILKEFPERDNLPRGLPSKNKTDYRIEKTLIKSNREKDVYGNVEFKSFNSKVMTENEFKKKCDSDAHQLYIELKTLPAYTLEKLFEFLFEDM